MGLVDLILLRFEVLAGDVPAQVRDFRRVSFFVDQTLTHLEVCLLLPIFQVVDDRHRESFIAIQMLPFVEAMIRIRCGQQILLTVHARCVGVRIDLDSLRLPKFYRSAAAILLQSALGR